MCPYFYLIFQSLLIFKIYEKTYFCTFLVFPKGSIKIHLKPHYIFSEKSLLDGQKRIVLCLLCWNKSV